MTRLIRRLRRRERSRGQSLVEFALVLPILLLLVLITVDFGRALYGWVVLQNSARIAAKWGLSSRAPTRRRTGTAGTPQPPSEEKCW